MAYIQQSLHHSEEAEFLLKYINRKMLSNKNFLSVVTGATGSGKSYSCLRIAEKWYEFYFNKPFPIKNVCFSVEDLVQRLNSGDLKKGDLIIGEEIGVGANAKNFQSTINKALQFILQSFRNLNIIILFNVPHFSFFDKTARMLMHSHIQTVRIDKAKQMCILKPYFLTISQSTGKIYTKWIRVTTERGTRKITRLNLLKPSEELVNQYEEMKTYFVKSLIEDMEKKIKEKVKKERGNNIPLTERQEVILKYSKQGKTAKEIGELMGIATSTIHQNKNFMRRKGIVFLKPKEIKGLEQIKENLLGNATYEQK